MQIATLLNMTNLKILPDPFQSPNLAFWIRIYYGVDYTYASEVTLLRGYNLGLLYLLY